MNKQLVNIGGQLSRAKMKSIVGGRPYPGGGDGACPYACFCEGGAKAMAAPAGGGAICYCPDDSRIYGANCPWV